MLKFVAAMILLAMGQAANAEEVFVPNRLTCELFGVLSADPDVLNQTATAFIEGVLAGLMAAGFGERSELITTLDNVCRDDPTLTFGNAIATAFGS